MCNLRASHRTTNTRKQLHTTWCQCTLYECCDDTTPSCMHTQLLQRIILPSTKPKIESSRFFSGCVGLPALRLLPAGPDVRHHFSAAAPNVQNTHCIQHCVSDPLLWHGTKLTSTQAKGSVGVVPKRTKQTAFDQLYSFKSKSLT